MRDKNGLAVNEMNGPTAKRSLNERSNARFAWVLAATQR